MALHKGVRAASTWALLARKFFDVLRENSFPIASWRGAVIYPRLSKQRVRGGRKGSIPCKKQLKNQSIICRLCDKLFIRCCLCPLPPLFSALNQTFRLEIEPSGVLGGRSLWWSRRIRRALLVAALDQVASGRSSATSGGGIRSQLLSSAAEAWLEGAAGGGPF